MAMADHIEHTATSDLGVYSDEEADFLKAIDRYRSANHRPFPTWREVLCVLKSLGWRKVADPEPLPRFRERRPTQGGPA